MVNDSGNGKYRITSTWNGRTESIDVEQDKVTPEAYDKMKKRFGDNFSIDKISQLSPGDDIYSDREYDVTSTLDGNTETIRIRGDRLTESAMQKMNDRFGPENWSVSSVSKMEPKEAYMVTDGGRTQIWDKSRFDRSYENYKAFHPDATYQRRLSFAEEKSDEENYADVSKRLAESRSSNEDFIKEYEANRNAWEKASRHGFASPYESYVIENRDRYASAKREITALEKELHSNPLWQERRESMTAGLGEMNAALRKETEEYIAAHPDEESELLESAVSMNAYSPIPNAPVPLTGRKIPGSVALRYKDERDKYIAARRLMDDSVKLFNAPSRYGNGNGFANYLKGMGDTFSDIDFWTRGLTSIADNMQLYDVLSSFQEKFGKVDANAITEQQLDGVFSPAEKALLNAFATNALVQSERASDLSLGYQAGQGTTESLGYMAEFILTGGVGKAASAPLKTALTKWLASGLTKMTAGAVKKAAKVAGKYGVGLLTDAIKTAAMTGVMPSTYDNIAASLVEVTEEGKLPEANKALGTAIVDSMIEQGGEIRGSKVLSALTGKIAGKIGSMMPDELVRTLKDNGVTRFLKEGGYDGLPEEMIEEWWSAALRSVTIDPDALKDFATVDSQLVMSASFIPITLMGGVASGGQRLHLRRRFENSEKKLRDVLRNSGYADDQADYLVSVLRNATPQTISDRLTPIINKMASESSSLGQAKELFGAAADFAESSMRYRTNEALQSEKDKEARDTEKKSMLAQTGESEFWMNVPLKNGMTSQEVQEAETISGEHYFVLGDRTESGEIPVIDADGNKSFLNEGEIEFMSERSPLDDWLSSKIMRRRSEAETERMAEDETAQIHDLRTEAYNGRDINIGTEEAPVHAVVLPAQTQADDFVIVQTDDGATRTLSWNEFGSAIGSPVQVHTDAEMETREADLIDDDRSARERDLAEEAARLIPDTDDGNIEDGHIEEAVDIVFSEEVTPDASGAADIPLKEDGTVDETSLWNQNPEQWALWNDGQRNDGGRDSDMYIANAIGTLNADIVGLESAYAKEPDMDARQSIRGEIEAKTQRLSELQNIAAHRDAVRQGIVNPVAANEGTGDSMVGGNADAQAESSVPTDENGRPLYYLASVEASLADIYSQGLTQDEIDGFIDANMAESEKELKKLSDKAPKIGTDIQSYRKAKSDHESAVASVRSRIDYWNQMKAVIEALYRQFPPVYSAEDFKSGTAFDLTPQTPEELAASVLSRDDIRINVESFDRETGFGTTERRRFPGLFVKNGGLTLDRIAEMVQSLDQELSGMTANDSLYGNDGGILDRNDPMAVKDAVISLLASVGSKGDIASFILRNRQRQHRLESEAVYNEYALAFENEQGMTPDEYSAYREAEVRDIILSGTIPQDKINSIFIQENTNSQNNERTDDTGTDAAVAPANDTGQVQRNERGTDTDTGRGSETVLHQAQVDNSRGPEVGGHGAKAYGNAGIQDGAAQEAGRPLTKEEADALIASMERNAVPAPELELTPENWIAEFGEDGIVDTPIGKVKMGENQLAKLFLKRLEKEFGMIKPTLTNPDIVIAEQSEAKDENAERNTSLLFVKTFERKVKKIRHFASVTVRQDGMKVVVSNHILRHEQLRGRIGKGELLWNRFESNSDSPGENQGLVTTSANSPDGMGHGSNPQRNSPFSASKGNENSIITNKSGLDIVDNPIQGLESYTRDEIRSIVRDYTASVISESGLDAEVVDVEIHGSRNRGDAKEDSDLDVVVEYHGKSREDDMFNALNNETNPLEIEGVRIDINPIRSEETGNMASYMSRSREYDEGKMQTGAPTVYSDSSSDTGTLKTNAGVHLSDFAKGVADEVYSKLPDNLKGRVSVRSSSDGNEPGQSFIQRYDIDGKPSKVYLISLYDTDINANPDFFAIEGYDVNSQERWDEYSRMFDEYLKSHPDVRAFEHDEAGALFDRFEDALGFSKFAEERMSDADIRLKHADGALSGENFTDEEKEIISKALTDGTYMKAPNGTDSKLSVKQWAQVRTKAFKEWFGDWEKAARIEKLRRSTLVEITGNEITPSDDLKQYKKNALEYGKKLRGKYTNKDTGITVIFSSGNKNGGLKEVLQHDISNTAHIQSVAAIPQIIEDAIYIDSIENEDKEKNPNVSRYHYYVCGLRIGGTDYTVRAVIAEQNNGNRYYDHKLTEIEKSSLIDQIDLVKAQVDDNKTTINLSPQSGLSSTGESGETKRSRPAANGEETIFSPVSDIKDKRLLSLLQTNLQKPVDENGEPRIEDVSAFSLTDDGTRLRRGENSSDDRNLIAVHNISADKLKQAFELGGFPMPSIAVTKADVGHTEFGEISLVFDKESINPTDRRNKVYGEDAWTPTFPSVGYKLNEDKTSDIYRRANAAGRLPFFNPVSFYPDNYERHIEGFDSASLVDHFRDDYGAKQFYLSEKGDPVENFEQHDEEKYSADRISLYEKLLEEIGIERLKNDSYDALDDDLKQIISQHDGVDFENMKPHRVRMRIENTRRNAIDYAENGNRKTESDIEATKKKIDERIDQKEFGKWLEDLFSGIVEKKGIRNDKDPFTPYGNSRKWEQLYDEITLDNVVNAMQRQASRGGQGLFNGSIFGAAQDEFKSIEEIRQAARERIRSVDDAELKRQRQKITDRLSAINIPGVGNNFSDIMDMAQNIQDAVARSHTAKGIHKYLKDFYPKVTLENAKEIEGIVKDIQKMTARYFEAKPYRAVGFDEVMLAVVPDNVDKAVLDGLRQRNIPVEMYESGNAEQCRHIVEDASRAAGLLFRRAYHGSAADFDRFDHSFMGTGEGAQAYGWGTYVTEVDGIARSYAEKLTQPARDNRTVYKRAQIRENETSISVIKSMIDEFPDAQSGRKKHLAELENELAEQNRKKEQIAKDNGTDSFVYKNFMFYAEDIISDLERSIRNARKNIGDEADYNEHRKKQVEELEAENRKLQTEVDEIEKQVLRNLYTVEIPEDTGENYLEWNRPIPETVDREQLWDFTLGAALSASEHDETETEMLSSDIRGSIDDAKTGEQLYKAISLYIGDKEASLLLHDMGFAGIKYPAQYRSGGRADDAKNYVIFKEDDVQITDHTRFRGTEQDIEKVNRKFNEQLERLTEKNADNIILRLGLPSPVLQGTGIPNREIALYGNKLIKKAKTHGYNISDVKDLPLYMEHPIAVFKGSYKDGYAILTTMRINNENALVSIDIRKAEVQDLNLVTLVFDKKSKGVIDWINNGKLLYADKEKVLDYLSSSAPIADATNNQELSSATNIVENFENPKLPARTPVQAAMEAIREDRSIREDNSQVRQPMDGTPQSIGAAAEATAHALGVEVNYISRDEMPTDSNGVQQQYAKGYQRAGRIYVCLENHRSEEDAMMTVMHEAVGHKGLRALVGPQNMDRFCMSVFRAASPEVRAGIFALSYKYDMHIGEAVEEYLAGLAEKGKFTQDERSFFRKVIDALMDLLERIGIHFSRPFGVAEAKWLLWQSYHALEGNDIFIQSRRTAIARRLGFSQVQNARKVDIDRRMRRSESDKSAINSAAASYADATVDVFNRLKETYVDQYAPLESLIKAVEDASGRPAEIWENPMLSVYRTSSVNQAEKTEFLTSFMQPMWTAVKELSEKTDKGIDGIVRYVMLKHGMERNDKFAKRDAMEHYRAEHAKAVSEARKKYTGEELNAALAKAEIALNGNLSSVDAGVDPVYLRNRETDYSGLMNMFSEYNWSGKSAERMPNESREQYNRRCREARRPKYASLAEVETAAKSEIDEIEDRAAPECAVLWEKIRAATGYTLQHQYRAGMLSKESYDRISSMFEYYVPLRGFEEDTAEDIYQYYNRNASSDFTPPLAKAKGRKSVADNPFAQIGVMAESAIQQDNNNKAKLALYYFVSNRPGNDLVSLSKVWYELDRIDSNGKKTWKEVYPDFTEVGEDGKPRTSAEILADFESRMKRMQESGTARQGRNKLDVSDRVVHVGERSRQEHMIPVMVNGEKVNIIVQGNPRAAQAMNGLLNPDSRRNVLDMSIGLVTRFMANNFTSRNPEFWISNLQRDLLFSYMNVSIREGSEYAKKYRNNISNGFKAVVYSMRHGSGSLGDSRLERMYREFVENGGVTGYTRLASADEYENMMSKYLKTEERGKLIQGLHIAFDKLRLFSEGIENVARFTAYFTSRESGKDIASSIMDAKNITVNFNRKGSASPISWEESENLMIHGRKLNMTERAIALIFSSLAPYLKSSVAFFNAAIQSLSMQIDIARRNPKRFAAWMAGYLALGMLNAILHAMLDDDDDYLDMPDWERRNNFLVGANGFYLKWAIPQESRPFYAMGDILVNWSLGRMRHKNVFVEATESFAEIMPPVMPTAFQPVMELVMNEDYMGAPIYKKMPWDESNPAYQRVYRNTNEILVGFSELLNTISGGDYATPGAIGNGVMVNPGVWQHFIEGATGGTGQFIMRVMNTPFLLRDKLTREEEWSWRNTPLLNRVIVSNDDRTRNSYLNEVYWHYKDIYDSVDWREKKYRKMRDAERLQELHDSPEYEIAEVFRHYEKELEHYDDILKEETDDAVRKQIMSDRDEYVLRPLTDDLMAVDR